MNVEYTGRHYEVTTANRKDVEAGLDKIRKILRDRFETILKAQDFPLPVAEIRMASDPLHTAARGALVAALTDM